MRFARRTSSAELRGAVTTSRELFNVRTPPQALDVLLQHVPARADGEEVPTRDALDRVLAEDVSSPADLPTFRRSTMDGFAVRAADVPGELRVVGEIPAGSSAARGLAPREAMSIMTEIIAKQLAAKRSYPEDPLIVLIPADREHEFYDLTDPIVEIRDTLNRIARKGALLYS